MSIIQHSVGSLKLFVEKRTIYTQKPTKQMAIIEQNEMTKWKCLASDRKL